VTAFDTEKPPRWYNAPERKILLSFEDNPEARRPFGRWLDSGEAWEAFGEWADRHGRMTAGYQARMQVYGPCETCGSARDTRRTEVKTDAGPGVFLELICPSCEAKTAGTSRMQELADVIHGLHCSNTDDKGGCRRYRAGGPHHDFYQLRAVNLLGELEPVIGIANVIPVVRAVLEECD
jgi:hypothetical protein